MKIGSIIKTIMKLGIVVMISVCFAKYVDFSLLVRSMEKEKMQEENVIVEDKNNIGDISSSFEVEKRDDLNTNSDLTNAQMPIFSENVVEEEVVEKVDYENGMQDRFYYEQLDEYGKIIYARMTNEYENMKTGKAIIDFGTQFNQVSQTEEGRQKVQDAFQAALNALIYDRPEYFFLDTGKLYFYTTTKTRGTKTTYEYYIGPTEAGKYLKDEFPTELSVDRAIKSFEKLTSEIVLYSPESEYEIVKNAHKWIIEHTEYDETVSLPNIRDIYGVFENGVAVCAGYANAFKYILDRAGIPCLYVPGEGVNDGEVESHAWNYVKLDGNWYFVDCTWDDPIIIGTGYVAEKVYYTYFLKGQRTINDTHIVKIKEHGDIKFTVPALSELDYKK